MNYVALLAAINTVLASSFTRQLAVVGLQELIPTVTSKAPSLLPILDLVIAELQAGETTTTTNTN